MFYMCTKLSYVKCLATEIADDCFNQWLVDVSEFGTFVKAARAQFWTQGGSGIPRDWDVEDADILCNDDGNEEPVEGEEIDL